MPAPLGMLVADPKVRALLATLGTPYHWRGVAWASGYLAGRGL
jgi:hypothetical protein